MTAIFHYSMQLSMIVFAPHVGAELDWLQLTNNASRKLLNFGLATGVVAD